MQKKKDKPLMQVFRLVAIIAMLAVLLLIISIMAGGDLPPPIALITIIILVVSVPILIVYMLYGFYRVFKDALKEGRHKVNYTLRILLSVAFGVIFWELFGESPLSFVASAIIFFWLYNLVASIVSRLLKHIRQKSKGEACVKDSDAYDHHHSLNS